MNFFTNKIVNPVGNGGPSFDEWLADFLTKTAEGREAKPEKGDDSRGAGRGQVINTEGEEAMTNNPEMPKEQGGNARPDKGGKTDQAENKQTDKGGSDTAPVKEAGCGKEMGESDDAGKVTEDHTEAGPGDDKHPEPKILINNDPNYQKGESTDPAKATGKGKKQPGEPVTGKSSFTKAQFKKIAMMERKEKLQLFAYLSAQRSNTWLPVKTAEGESHIPSLAYVEAVTGVKFANMQEDEKTWFKSFWSILYPEEYVSEMVKDR